MKLKEKIPSNNCEILDKKNINSSDKDFKINQYSFNKNYNLELEDEEIYEGIIFSTTGTIT